MDDKDIKCNEFEKKSCREEDGCPIENAVLRREWKALRIRLQETEEWARYLADKLCEYNAGGYEEPEEIRQDYLNWQKHERGKNTG